MADFEMWGPAQDGARLYQQDAQKEQLNNLAIQQGQQQLQMNQIKMEEEAQKQKQSQQQALKLQDVMLRNKTSSTFELGEDLLHQGLIKEGSKVLQVASQAQLHTAQADVAKATAGIKQTEEKARVLGVLSGALEDAHSQEDYNKIVDRVEKFTGKPLPDELKNAKWTPELKDSFLNMAMSAKDRAHADLEKQKAAAKAEHDKTVDTLNKARQAEVVERTKAIKLKEEREGKDNKVKAISKNDLNAAFNLVKQQFPDADLDKPESYNAAYYIASQAQELVRKNKGLDLATALQQAKAKAQEGPNPVLKDDVIKKSSFFGMGADKEEHRMKFDASKASTPKSTLAPPPIDTVQGGYKFKGGDPADKNNWEKQ